MELSDESITATTFSSSLQQIHQRLHASEAVSRVHNVAWLNLPSPCLCGFSLLSSVQVLWLPPMVQKPEHQENWQLMFCLASVCAPVIPSGRTWSLIIGEAYLVKHCTVVDWQDDSVSVTSSPFHDLLYGFPLICHDCGHAEFISLLMIILFFFFWVKITNTKLNIVFQYKVNDFYLQLPTQHWQVMICHCIRTF